MCKIVYVWLVNQVIKNVKASEIAGSIGDCRMDILCSTKQNEPRQRVASPE